MGDAFKKVQSGDSLRIPAATFNAFIDAAQDFHTRTIGNTGTGPGLGILPPGIVLVRNDSDAAQDQFAVLGIDGIVISPDDNEQEFKSHIVLSGVVPAVDDETDHSGRFVVLAEPLKAGSIGRAFVDHVCQVKVSVEEDEEEPRFADVADGEAGHLAAAVDGSAMILWRKEGSDAQWAVVRLGTPAGSGGAVKRCTVTEVNADFTCDVAEVDSDWTEENIGYVEISKDHRNFDPFCGHAEDVIVSVVQVGGEWRVQLGHAFLAQEW